MWSSRTPIPFGVLKWILIQSLEMRNYSFNVRLDNLLKIAINEC